MVQNCLAHHDVEGRFRLQQLQRRTDELGLRIHRVMSGSNLRCRDGLFGDVDPRYERAAQREQDRVATVATTDVENVLALDVVQE